MAGLGGNVIVLVNVAVFFGILAGLLLHKMIGSYVEGAIGGLECILIAGLYLGLVISVITLHVPAILVVLVLFALVLVLPRWRERKTAQSFHDERVEQFRSAIASDPLNMAARSRLAEELHKIGRFDEAIAEQTQLVQMAPGNLAEARRLEQLIREKDERISLPIICPSCGHKNPPDRTRCAECEGELRLTSELKRWLMQGGIKQIAVIWAITITVMTIVLFVFSALSLYGRILIVALFLLVVVLAELLYAYRSF